MCESLLLSIVLLAPAESPVAPRPVQQNGFNATVRVSDPATGTVGTGSVIAVKDGFAYVLTAAHLLTGDSAPTVETFSAAKPAEADAAFAKCTVRFRATDADLAVVRVPAGKRVWSSLSLAPVAFTDRALDRGWALGCDNGTQPRLQDIVIVGKQLVRKAGGQNAFHWETKGTTTSGRSGGPLLNAQGQLIGVCSGTQEGASYYTHADEIRKALLERGLDWMYAEKTDR
jgi:S1-C subfamily serine protease